MRKNHILVTLVVLNLSKTNTRTTDLTWCWDWLRCPRRTFSTVGSSSIPRMTIDFQHVSHHREVSFNSGRIWRITNFNIFSILPSMPARRSLSWATSLRFGLESWKCGRRLGLTQGQVSTIFHLTFTAKPNLFLRLSVALFLSVLLRLLKVSCIWHFQGKLMWTITSHLWFSR